jgi:hypothetical protein
MGIDAIWSPAAAMRQTVTQAPDVASQGSMPIPNPVITGRKSR